MDLVGKPQTLRVLNREAVEALLRACGPMTKAELSRRTGLSLVTVGKTVDELLAEGRIVSPGMGEPREAVPPGCTPSTGGSSASWLSATRRGGLPVPWPTRQGKFFTG